MKQTDFIAGVPDDAEVVRTWGEGHFRAIIWRHRRTGVLVVAFAGYLNEVSWDDESDPLPILMRVLSFLTELNPMMLVWDLSGLRSISCFGLAHLEGCHNLLSSHGCETAMLVCNQLRPTIAFNHLLTRCQLEKDITEAILYVYLNRWQAA